MKIVLNQNQATGEHKLDFDLKEIPEGVSFLRFTAGETINSKKTIKLN